MADETRRPGTRSGSPELVRSEVERERARTVSTLDEIEGAPRRKKERIESRLDVFRQLRDHPVAALGLVFGAGVLLGLLTGGDDEQEEPAARSPDAVLWERRARHLRRVTREQEAELTRLREAAWREEALDADIEEESDDEGWDAEEDDEEWEAEEEDYDGDEPEDEMEASPIAAIEEEGTNRLSAFIREGMQRMIRRRTA